MTVTRPFAYTNRDYDSLLADLRRRMMLAIPEWTGFDAGFEALLLELYAYVGDQLNFYVDRMGNEAFLATAVLRESVLNIAQMFGYIPAPQTAAVCTIQFTVLPTLAENVTIPAGTALYAQTEGLAPVYFETQSSITINSGTFTGTVSAAEGRTETLELIGTSTGGAGQAYILHIANYVRDSVLVYTQSGPLDPITGLPTLVSWTQYDRLIDANFYNRAYAIIVDEDGFSYISFGDAVSGQIPPVNTNIYVTYRHGVGSMGNVGIGAVRSFVSAGLLTSKIAAVTNTTAATGGADRESIDSMRTSIPRSLSTIERAVSTADYASLATRVPGVAKANATAAISTAVTLYVAPVGGGAPSTPLLNAVTAYFNGPPSRVMIGTTVTPTAPTYVPINVTLTVTVNPRFRQDIVVAAVKLVITNLYAFTERTFAELLMKADVFHEVVEVDGVDYVDITVFSRTGSGTADVQLAASELATAGTLVVTPTGGVVLP